MHAAVRLVTGASAFVAPFPIRRCGIGVVSAISLLLLMPELVAGAAAPAVATSELAARAPEPDAIRPQGIQNGHPRVGAAATAMLEER